MLANIDDLLPTAKEIQRQAALREAEKADEHARRLLAAQAEKQRLIDELASRPAFPRTKRSNSPPPSFSVRCAMA